MWGSGLLKYPSAMTAILFAACIYGAYEYGAYSAATREASKHSREIERIMRVNADAARQREEEEAARTAKIQGQLSEIEAKHAQELSESRKESAAARKALSKYLANRRFPDSCRLDADGVRHWNGEAVKKPPKNQ